MLPVGLIGCGRIAAEGHLPAYRAAGVEVVAVCDVIRERAEDLARRFGVPTVCASPEELMHLPAVRLLDVTTRPSGRAELVRRLLESGKPLLIQKPLAYSVAEAEEICQLIESMGVVAAVNHSARWMPVHLRLQEWIREGRLGEVYAIHHLNRFREDVVAWYTDHPDYLFVDHGIHYLDLVRCIVGSTPTAVAARVVRVPGQVARCPLAYVVQLRWEDRPDLLVALYFNNAVPGPASFECLWHVDGSRASARMTLESIALHERDGNVLHDERLPGGWIPDGFVGAYTSLVEAIRRRDVPGHAPRDHLRSLSIATTAAISARRGGEWTQIPAC